MPQSAGSAEGPLSETPTFPPCYVVEELKSLLPPSSHAMDNLVTLKVQYGNVIVLPRMLPSFFFVSGGWELVAKLPKLQVRH